MGDEGDGERTSMLTEKRQEAINKVLDETQIEPMNIMDALTEYDEGLLPASTCRKLVYIFIYLLLVILFLLEMK